MTLEELMTLWTLLGKAFGEARVDAAYPGPSDTFAEARRLIEGEIRSVHGIDPNEADE